MISNNDNHPVVISSITFNKNNECLLCTTSCGFIVYNVNPFNSVITRNFPGGLRMGQMYLRTNLFFLNGTGLNDDYPINRVCVWDDQKQKKIAEVSLNSKVTSLYISNGPNFIVASSRRAYIYEIEKLTQLASFDVCSFSLVTRLFKDDFIMCHQSLALDQRGIIVVKSKNRYFNINAHKTNIGKVALSNNGKLIATSSLDGVIIKLFNQTNGQLVSEYRRGTFSKTISYLGFSEEDSYLLCGTTNGSVHLFNILEYEFNANTLWGILRRRSNHSLHIGENIISIKLLEISNIIYIITASKFYSCQLLEDNIIIKKTSLLIYKKDPFTPSPKRNRVLKDKDKDKDMDKDKDRDMNKDRDMTGVIKQSNPIDIKYVNSKISTGSNNSQLTINHNSI